VVRQQAGAVTDVRLDIEQIAGQTAEIADVHGHDLHQPDGTLGAHRPGIQRRIFDQEHAGQDARAYPGAAGLVHHGGGDPVRQLRVAHPAGERHRQRAMGQPPGHLPLERGTIPDHGARLHLRRRPTPRGSRP
jgi:hypothetical protein